MQQSGFLGGRDSILAASYLAILVVSGLGGGRTAFRSALERLHGLEAATGKSLAHRRLRTGRERHEFDLHLIALVEEPAGIRQRLKRNCSVAQSAKGKRERTDRRRLYSNASTRTAVVMTPKTVFHMPSPGVMYTPQFALATPVK